MAEKSIEKCDVCKEDADYLDVVGPNIIVPFCHDCFGASLICLELEKRRAILVEEWDEWRVYHPNFRLLT